MSSVLIGWHKLVESSARYAGEVAYPIPAYSEFMPAPHLGLTPYGDIEHALFSEADPFGWSISEMEEEVQIKPGLKQIAGHIMGHLLNLAKHASDSYIGGHNHQNLIGNPYWPPELASRGTGLAHERYVCLLPLALSVTQDDKGRLLWSLFGGSEPGPETVFWKSYYSAPNKELPAEQFYEFLSRLFAEAYGEKTTNFQDLWNLGFRILPTAQAPAHALLPSWAKVFVIQNDSSFEDVRFVLTFRPFMELPDEVKNRYLAGTLNLLPYPGSLVFWGMPTYANLQKELPLAIQIPLLRLVPRNGGPAGIHVPQSGWIHEPRPGLDPGEIDKELLLHDYTRTHRWNRLQRYDDELSINPRVEKVAKVLFSTDLDVIGLYDKPMARNCQLWTRDFELLLDGPNATKEDLKKAEAVIVAGGLFGYRFLFPAAQVGQYEIYWHRPVVAYLSMTGEMALHPEAPAGYLTAYEKGARSLENPTELWPRIQNRPEYHSALFDFHNPHDHYHNQTPINLVTLLDSWHALEEQALPASFVRHELRISKELSLDEWIAALPNFATAPEQGQSMQSRIRSMLAGASNEPQSPIPITYSETATRSFELAWWNDIKTLAEGEYKNKDNADCVQDATTLSQESCQVRDLDRLGDYLIARHKDAIHQAGMDGKALCGEIPFQWKTDFEFPLFGGWKSNQVNDLHERDILVVIPGKKHDQAVILADHYDTAYMEDLYDRSRGGTGARSSAAGADDNYSATATLLQAAPIYLKLAKEGRLERDIWLLHLTGEEFPSDCLGARNFCQMLIEKKLSLHLDEDSVVDLSPTRLTGVFVMDMIAHNRDHDRNIFQISPGRGRQSLQLAMQAHLANMLWNASTHQWNEIPERKTASPARRSPDGIQIPQMAPYPVLFGEIRTREDPQSSLYNTDGQIFSDMGIPVVLFMEDYDINRSGYHDTKDNLENIDLDYGAAFAAIAIEACARVAAA
ncbi:MAG: M28 family peptidase [Anaerolineales bacterium]